MMPFDPKKPLYRFTARPLQAKRWIHLFKDGDFVYFRPKNTPLDWWGVFWGDYPLGWAQVGKEWEKVEQIAYSHLSQGYIWRVFEMYDPREASQRKWRIIWRPDFGYALPLDSCESYGVYFWPREANLNLWKSPTSAIRSHFEVEWHNPQSDVRAVLPWCDLSDDERGLRGVHWERGSFEELVGVVGAAMKLLPIWDEVEYRDEKIILALAWDEEGQRLENHSPHLHNAGSSWKQWKKLHQRIEERNWGIYTAEGNRGDWKFDWIKYESPRSGYRCVAHWLEIHEPTQHERIEASLVLREWLAKNAPDLMMEWFAV